MNKTVEETTTWSIKLSSHCETDLNLSEVLEVLNSYEHEEYKDFKSNLGNSMSKHTNGNSVAEWQVCKGNEIEEKWHGNLLHTLQGGKLSVSILFETDLPEEFELGDVIEWTEGFNRLGKIWPMVLIKTKLMDGTYDKDISDRQTKMIKDLIENQDFKIEIIKQH